MPPPAADPKHEQEVAQHPTIRVLRAVEVQEQCGISHSSLYTYVRLGLFPKSFPLGIRSVGWMSDEVKLVQQAWAAGYGQDKIKALVEKIHTARARNFNEVVL
jgi:prophage regulatory protein